MLSGIFGLVVLTMKLWPATPIARFLHSALVEFPLGLAGGVERKHLILIGLLMFGGQFVLLVGPELAFVYALDLSLYGEAVIATTLAAGAVRVRYVLHRLKGFKENIGRELSGGRARPRSRRTKAQAALRNGSANDDDHAWAWAWSLRAA